MVPLIMVPIPVPCEDIWRVTLEYEPDGIVDTYETLEEFQLIFGMPWKFGTFCGTNTMLTLFQSFPVVWPIPTLKTPAEGIKAGFMHRYPASE